MCWNSKDLQLLRTFAPSKIFVALLYCVITEIFVDFFIVKNFLVIHGEKNIFFDWITRSMVQMGSRTEAGASKCFHDRHLPPSKISFKQPSTHCLRRNSVFAKIKRLAKHAMTDSKAALCVRMATLSYSLMTN